jgi:PPOX class probable F420-dependent enzyme
MSGMAFELTSRIERHLTGDLIAWLTTVTPTGRPAPRPVWFVWDGTRITIYSLNNSAKLRHIEANDQVTVHFNSTPDGGDVVVIGGRASRVPGAQPPSRFPGLLDKYGGRIEQMGRAPQWYDDNYSVAVQVTPERAWTIPADRRPEDPPR